MVFQWKIPSIVKADAQAAGELCEALSRSVGLTPKNLLDANREEGTPLHDEFEWDDSIAAESWREEQASRIIRLLVIKPEPTGEAVRAFINIKAEIETRSYKPITVIINDPTLREQMLHTALSDLQAFSKKYADLQELKPVFDAVNTLICAGG